MFCQFLVGGCMLGRQVTTKVPCTAVFVFICTSTAVYHCHWSCGIKMCMDMAYNEGYFLFFCFGSCGDALCDDLALYDEKRLQVLGRLWSAWCWMSRVLRLWFMCKRDSLLWIVLIHHKLYPNVGSWVALYLSRKPQRYMFGSWSLFSLQVSDHSYILFKASASRSQMPGYHPKSPNPSPTIMTSSRYPSIPSPPWPPHALS